MSKDENVISLEERREAKQAEAKQAEANPSAPSSSGPPREAADLPGDPIPGRLIWLHCPTCNTLEYTELALAGARVHNSCGTQVEEIQVDLDLRAEHTITEINLERLNILGNLLEDQRKVYEEYRNRLALAAGRALERYPTEETGLEALPVAEVDAFGLLISRFFHHPERLFSSGSTPSSVETEDGEPDSPDD